MKGIVVLERWMIIELFGGSKFAAFGSSGWMYTAHTRGHSLTLLRFKCIWGMELWFMAILGHLNFPG
jgi:hypothetical protein